MVIKRASQPQPKVEAGAALRKAKSESISSAAVKNLEEAVDEQAKKNDARRQQQLLQAATEYMKKTWAPKAKACACRGATQDMQMPADLRRGLS